MIQIIKDFFIWIINLFSSVDKKIDIAYEKLERAIDKLDKKIEKSHENIEKWNLKRKQLAEKLNRKLDGEK